MGMTCSCGYTFLFDPSVDGMTDKRFLALVKRASANDTYYFTLPQLEGRFMRLSRPSKVARGLWTLALGGASAAFFATAHPIAGIVFGIFGFISLLNFMVSLSGTTMTPGQMPAAVAKWTGSKGELERLLRQPALSQPPPDYVEADIYVLSENGYPGYLEKVANDILAQHPETPVFLLHDASTGGISMQDRLTGAGKLNIAQHRVIDLGLTPDDVRRLFDVKVTGEFNLDMLPYRGLTNMVSMAMRQGVPFSKLPKKEIDRYDDTGSSFG
jgi:hypothetical protein